MLNSAIGLGRGRLKLKDNILSSHNVHASQVASGDFENGLIFKVLMSNSFYDAGK